jgi:hypothetical protein
MVFVGASRKLEENLRFYLISVINFYYIIKKLIILVPIAH